MQYLFFLLAVWMYAIQIEGQTEYQNCLENTEQLLMFPVDTQETFLLQSLAVQADKTVALLSDGVSVSQLIGYHTTGLAHTCAYEINEMKAVRLAFDSHERILVVGGYQNVYGCIGRYRIDDQSVDSGFIFDTTYNHAQFVRNDAVAYFSHVVELQSGIIVAAGQDKQGNGRLVAYNQDGSSCDFFGKGQGFYQLDTCLIDDLVVDTADAMYVIARTAGSVIKIYKILPDGSGCDSIFNQGQPLSTGLLSFTYEHVHCAGISDTESVYIMAVNRYTSTCTVHAYNAQGQLVWHTSITDCLNPAITSVQLDRKNRLVFAGYDQKSMFIGRLLPDGTLDTFDNPYVHSQGIVRFVYDYKSMDRYLVDLHIAADGSLIFGAYEIGANQKIVNCIGTFQLAQIDASPQIPRYPQAACGYYDKNFGTQGAQLFDIKGVSDGPCTMHRLENGSMLIYYACNGSTVLQKMHADYTVDTSFSSSDQVNGVVELLGLVHPTAHMIDDAGNIYCAGDNGTHGILYKISPQGQIIWSVLDSSWPLLTISSLSQLASGRILISGSQHKTAVMVACNPLSGVIDYKFAHNGYYKLGIDTLIIDTVITHNDTIVYAYTDAVGRVHIDQLSADGSSVMTRCMLPYDGGLASNDHAVMMRLDHQGKLMVIKLCDQSTIKAYRHTVEGVCEIGPCIIAGLSNVQALQTVATFDDGSTLILLQHQNQSMLGMIRLTKDLQHDLDFAYPSGILYAQSTHCLQEKNYRYCNFEVTHDQHVLVCSQADTYTLCFEQLFYDRYVKKVEQNQSLKGNVDRNFAGGHVLFDAKAISDCFCATTVQPDGKIIAVGYITTQTGCDPSTKLLIARYTHDGILDVSFAHKGYTTLDILQSSRATSVALQSDGKIVVAGFVYIGSAFQGLVARYHSDGSLDTTGFGYPYGYITTSFAHSCDSRLYAVAVQPDGKIVAAGSTHDGLVNVFALVRYASDGSLDTKEFVSSVGYARLLVGDGLASDNCFYALVLQDDGAIVAGGYAKKDATTPCMYAIVRFMSNGELDTKKFAAPYGYTTTSITGNAGASCITSLALHQHGKIIAAGYASSSQWNAHHAALVSYHANGTLDTHGFNAPHGYMMSSFDSYQSAIHDIVVQADGSILAGGTLLLYPGNDHYKGFIARYKPDGVLDYSFGKGKGFIQTQPYGADQQLMSLSMHENALVLAGKSKYNHGAYHACLARYHVNVQDQHDKLYDPLVYLPLPEHAGLSLVPVPSKVSSTLQQSDGSYYIAIDDGVHTSLVYFSSFDVVISDFGVQGIVTLPYLSNLTSMMIDHDGNLAVTGQNTSSDQGTGIFMKLDARTGDLILRVDQLPIVNVSLAGQQTNGRYILFGQSKGNACIIGLNCKTGQVDQSFAERGYSICMQHAHIKKCIIDQHDAVYCLVVTVDKQAILQKVDLQGLHVVWQIPVGFDVMDNSYALAFDQYQRMVLAMTTDISTLVVSWYNRLDGCLDHALDVQSLVENSSHLQLTGLMIDSLPCSAGRIILFGHDQNKQSSFMLRLCAQETGLDESFYEKGIQWIDFPDASLSRIHTGFINQAGNIFLAGYGIVQGCLIPYCLRADGTLYVGQYEAKVPAGLAGRINHNVGSFGIVSGAHISSDCDGLAIKSILPTAFGSYYVGYAHGVIGRLRSDLSLDTVYQAQDFQEECYNMHAYDFLLDGAGRVMVVGTHHGAGFAQRYQAGNACMIDMKFGIEGIVNIPHAQQATAIVQQSLGRYVVAGTTIDGQGALFALNENGNCDTTFNARGSLDFGGGGNISGIFRLGLNTSICALLADAYDRLIVAYQHDTQVDIIRLTSAGQLDKSFGVDGCIVQALRDVDDPAQIKLAFDADGNIIIAAHIKTVLDGIAVKVYDGMQGTSVVYKQYTLPSLHAVCMTHVCATADNTLLVAGYHTDQLKLFIARLVPNSTGSYMLDKSFGQEGIIYGADTSLQSQAGQKLDALAVCPDGQIMVAARAVDRQAGLLNHSYMMLVYNNPYIQENQVCRYGQSDGMNDITLGASLQTKANLGLDFFATPQADATCCQVARAIQFPDDACMLIALDGYAHAGHKQREIFLKMFTMDGTQDLTFAPHEQQTVLSVYQDQYVTDMLTYKTVAGVHKAVIAGYALHNVLSTRQAFLVQYNLDTGMFDGSFGNGFIQPLGLVITDAHTLYTIAQQSHGRIIGAGMSHDHKGLLVGYTTDGILDTSFAVNGMLLDQNAAYGFYRLVIDSKNRLIVAYDQQSKLVVQRWLADGSAVDTSFSFESPVGSLTCPFNIQLALDAHDHVYCAVGMHDHRLRLFLYDTAGKVLQACELSGADLGNPDAVYTINRLWIDCCGRAIIVAHDTQAQNIVVIRLTALFTLDTSFHNVGFLSYALRSDYSGLTISDAIVHADGRITIIGALV